MTYHTCRIELLCLGTELLKDKVNTNIVAIAERLQSLGLSLTQTNTVGDCSADIERALKQSLQQADVLLICGGLGPTFDDLTRECVSKILKRPLMFSKKIVLEIRKKFGSRNVPMPIENERQAYLIQGAIPILNRFGTAPGQIIPYKNKSIILLPGPPSELIPMMDRIVCPYLKKKFSRTLTRSFVLHIFGYPESEIDERIEPVVKKNWDTKDIKTTFGILAHRSMIDVKASVEGKNKLKVERTISRIKKELYDILGNDIFGQNEETMESVVGNLLTKRKENLSVAESCTGGLIADKITNVPGSSNYFKEGIVSYSNESKIRLLGVRHETLKQYGAVSEQTAEEMAKGILKKSNSDWAISVTGIAGPSGGTKEKPLGLVYFSIASKKNIFTCSKKFYGSRLEIKERSALMALDLLRRKLSE